MILWYTLWLTLWLTLSIHLSIHACDHYGPHHEQAMLLEGEASVDVCLGHVMSDRGRDERLVYSIVDYAVMYRLRHLAEVLSLASPWLPLWSTPWLTL